MEVDASDYITGGVLSMEYEDGKWRSVAFLSKSLNKTERNYKIHDKEMLAVIRGLENQRHLLEGTKFKFEVWTDYKNLEYFMKAQKLNRKQACQAFYLTRFDFTLKYVLETKMGKANRLIRRPNWKVGTENDNSNQILIKDQWIHSLSEVVEGPEVEIVEKVLQGEEWKIERNLVLKKRKVYILRNKKLRVEIIQLYHDVLVAEHGGKQKMTELVMRNYWQPEVTKDVGRYVKECDMYQRMKKKTETPVGKLKLIKVLEKPQIYLMVDFITKLPLVAGKDTILVVYNRLSKIIHFVATMKRTLAEGLVRLFRDNMWKLYRLPESIVSNKGLQFAAEMMKELNNILEIQTKLSMSFYLQTDEQTEHMNQELEQYL